MNAMQKLRELPGLLLFLIILSGLITLICGWQVMTLEGSYDSALYSLRFQLWLAVTLLLLVIRLVVVRIIAAIDPKN